MAAIPPMRTGGGDACADLEYARSGKSVKQTMLEMTQRMHALAAKHARLSGRSVVHLLDYVLALRVLILPQMEEFSAMEVPTRVQNPEHLATREERVATLAALDWCALVLNNDTYVDSLGHRRVKPVDGDMSAERSAEEVANEAFGFCSDEVQLAHNDMYLMEWVAEHLDEAVADMQSHHMTPMHKSILQGLLNMEAEMAAVFGFPDEESSGDEADAADDADEADAKE